MKEYKKEMVYYCPYCKKAQEFIPNPCYMHICTDCKKEYSNRRLTMRKVKVRII